MHPRRIAIIALPLIVLLAVGRSLAFVPDDDMSPSYLKGDLVLITPGTPAPGAVVAVVDPLEPQRWTLRRVESTGGAVAYVDGAFRTSPEPPTVLDMGELPGVRVHKQGDHLVQHLDRPIRWDMNERGVPDGDTFVSADARDEAMDSRWWGPLPRPAVQGVVRIRIGVPGHPWRSWIGV